MPRSSPANNLLATLQQFVPVVVQATAELFTAAASAAGQLLQYLWFVQTPETGQKTQLLQPGMLSVCLSVLPKEGLSLLSTAAASSNSNPKDLQCPCFSSASPPLPPYTLDFSSKAAGQSYLQQWRGILLFPR